MQNPKVFCDWNRTVRYSSAVKYHSSFPYARALVGPTESVVSAHAEILRYGANQPPTRSLSTATSTSYRSTQPPGPSLHASGIPIEPPPTQDLRGYVSTSMSQNNGPVSKSNVGPSATDIALSMAKRVSSRSDEIFQPSHQHQQLPLTSSPPIMSRQQPYLPIEANQNPVQPNHLLHPQPPFIASSLPLNPNQQQSYSPAPTLSSVGDKTIVLDIVIGGEAFAIPIRPQDDPSDVMQRFDQMRRERLEARGEGMPLLTERQRARLAGTIAQACEDQRLGNTATRR